MKWTTKQLENTLQQKAPQWPALVCVYGEDGGQAKEYVKQIVATLAPNLDDPFLVNRFRAEDILDEPQALLESLQTMSFGLGRKLIYLEGVSNDLPTQSKQKLTKLIQEILPALHSEVTVVFSAVGYEPKDAVIKAIEKESNAVAVRCYVDNSLGLKGIVQKYLQKENKKISPDALAFLIENLGNDRAVTLGELEKLCIYSNEPQITLDDCLASVSAAPSVSAFGLCDAIGLRDRQKADEYLQKLREEGQDLTMILTLVTRHMRRLLQAKEMLSTQNMSVDQAMMSLKPPVFYGKQEFGRQLKGYPEKRLKTVLGRLRSLQLESRQGALNDDLVISRGILALAF